MKESENAFSRAATALGRIEGVVVSGQEILTSVGGAREAIEAARKSIDAVVQETAKLQAEVRTATESFREVGREVKSQHDRTIESVANQVGQAAARLGALEILASQEQLAAKLEKELELASAVSRELEETRRVSDSELLATIGELVGRSERKSIRLVSATLFFIACTLGLALYQVFWA